MRRLEAPSGGHENDVEKAGPRRPQTLPQAPQHEPIQLER